MTTRDRTVAAVLVLVACVGAYWFLLLSPKRDEAAKLGDKLAQQRHELSQTLGQVATALQAKRDYARNYATVARLGQAVPADDSVPSLVFQLDAAARASHVDFRGVKLVPGSATAVTPPPPPASSSSGSSSSDSSRSSSSTTPPAAPATESATAGLPPGATVGPAGFPTMPFALHFEGSFFHMSGFLARLERFVRAGGSTVRVGGRLLTVDGISLAPGPKGFPQIDASLAVTAYLIPPGQDAAGGASPTGPSGTATTPASSSGGTPAPATATVTPTR